MSPCKQALYTPALILEWFDSTKTGAIIQLFLRFVAIPLDLRKSLLITYYTLAVLLLLLL